MRRVVAVSLAAVLASMAVGGCPSPQLADPVPGTVSILEAGSYSGTLECTSVNQDGETTSESTVDAQVMVTEEGGLRLYNDNIAEGETLSQSQFGVTFTETFNTITETGDTVTIETTGSIAAGDQQVDTARTVTLRQVDAQTIEMTDETLNSSETSPNTLTNTCTGTISQ